MSIVFNFSAIKAALNRLMGAAPSGEAFSGLKDTKRVTGEHDFTATPQCARCLASVESTQDFPTALGKCRGAPLAAGTLLLKQRYFRYEADGNGGVVHVQTQDAPPFPGIAKRPEILAANVMAKPRLTPQALSDVSAGDGVQWPFDFVS